MLYSSVTIIELLNLTKEIKSYHLVASSNKKLYSVGLALYNYKGVLMSTTFDFLLFLILVKLKRGLQRQPNTDK